MKNTFIALCFLLAILVGNTLFAQSGKIVWDSISHKYLISPNVPIITALERVLEDKGYYHFCDDCPLVRDALKKFQKDNHLPIGKLDKETLKALGIERVLFIDGLSGYPKLQVAILKFQRENGLRVGYVDNATLKALGITDWKFDVW